jgi:hypothetical protein
MKCIKYIFIQVLILFCLTSCEDPIETEIDIPITFVVTLDTGIPEDPINPGSSASFMSSASYDLFNNPEIVDAVGTPDRIKDVRVTSVSYEYMNFSGNVDADVSGLMGFYNNSGISTAFETETINVANADLLGNQFDLAVSSESIARSLNVINVAYQGMSSASPANFDTKLRISLIVTVLVSTEDL